MTTKLNITPGPWKILKHCSTLIEGPNKRNVCSTGGYQTNFNADQTLAENEANARAISALPELIEELEYFIGCTRLWQEFDPEGTAHFLPDIRGRAIETLNKIKGKP